MRKIRDVLRLRAQGGLSQRQIAQSLGLGRTTVAEYLSRAESAGLGWPLPPDLEEAVVERRLFPKAGPLLPTERPQPEWATIHKELRRKGVTLFLLWQEYREIHPDGYQYSRFCDLYGRFVGKLHPVMHQVHRAGEKTFVDFSGLRPEIVDPRTGEVIPVELFVGALGASGYSYAEAVPSQELEHWIAAHQRMFTFFGGASAILVPDQLRSAVTKPCRYEAVINRTYEEMADYYGAVVIPARMRKPQDKAKAELSVLLCERWILARLRNHTFFSLAELNRAITQALEVLNDRPMQKLKVSRRQLFEQLDRPALKPLPAHRYELAVWSAPRVNIDYHVEVDGNYYSVPHQLMRERVEARATAMTIEVIFRSRRVASHRRVHGRGHFVTVHEHMPASHRAHLEWTPSRLISWAGKAGPSAAQLVTRVLESRPHPEQGYRACLGLMRLGKTYGLDRLEAASRRALRLESYSYRTVKNILSAGTDRLPLEEEPPAPSPHFHENVRGPEYYLEKETEAC
jgi:transposase